MPDFRLQDGFDSETYDNVVGGTSTTGVSVTGSLDAKGAWAQLAAATSRDAVGVLVTLWGGTNGSLIVDIGIGAAGSEVVLIPNLQYVGNADSVTFYLPVALAAGARIAARASANNPATSIPVSVVLLQEGLAGQGAYSRVTDYGTVTASSTGTTVTSGVANTKGAWTQLVASTANATSALLFAASYSASGNGVAFDLGVGAAGSEVALVTNLPVFCETTPAAANVGFLLGVAIPAGTRLAVRSQGSVASAAPRVILYGIE